MRKEKNVGKNIHPNIPKFTWPVAGRPVKNKLRLLQGDTSSFALPFHLHIPTDAEDY
ncbi:hypothetical protein [Mucilaginibacter rubeus]|uniref:hypothetical protein n=1 Tax=Mucilaginibacter rubeus TaxID=2027860 RepID=UPI001681B828|nr:hypothetical protein [Mucilaginibacter rubeus]